MTATRHDALVLALGLAGLGVGLYLHNWLCAILSATVLVLELTA